MVGRDGTLVGGSPGWLPGGVSTYLWEQTQKLIVHPDVPLLHFHFLSLDVGKPNGIRHLAWHADCPSGMDDRL